MRQAKRGWHHHVTTSETLDTFRQELSGVRPVKCHLTAPVTCYTHLEPCEGLQMQRMLSLEVESSNKWSKSCLLVITGNFAVWEILIDGSKAECADVLLSGCSRPSKHLLLLNSSHDLVPGLARALYTLMSLLAFSPFLPRTKQRNLCWLHFCPCAPVLLQLIQPGGMKCTHLVPTVQVCVLH